MNPVQRGFEWRYPSKFAYIVPNGAFLFCKGDSVSLISAISSSLHIFSEGRSMKCPKCHFDNPEVFEFCGKCGQRFAQIVATRKGVPRAEGERKYVTVLFSDLSGYTAMSEKLDPEEVKEITRRLFGEISRVISKYEGFVEKYIGDSVVALFGVPRAYEDDPVRAIRAAREIHELVDAESPQLERRIGQPLSMHSGINTGLVVIGEVDMEKGTHGIAGDTINLASRLQGLAKTGEILVGSDTYR
jgi:adenylate cyclase